MSSNILQLRPVVITTYRDRERHLQPFISAIKNKLPNAVIAVIEQLDNKPFNRGALFNVGFNEFEGEGDYFILHDVDLIPIPDRVDYSYCDLPTHISAHCSQFNYKLPYETCFGGVVIVTKEHYKVVNGFSNSFKGWGGEDDLFYMSFIQKKIPVNRKACWFHSLEHERFLSAEDYGHNLNLLKAGRDFDDGLSSCKYRILESKNCGNYIHLKVLLSSDMYSPEKLDQNTQL